MGNSQNALTMSEVSQAALYRGLCLERMSLNYQINFYTILSNYIKINPTPTHDQEKIQLSRKLMRKIIDVEKFNARFKRFKHNRPGKPKFLKQLQKDPDKNSLEFIEILNPEVLIKQETDELKTLKKHSFKLLELMKSLLEYSSQNLEKIQTNERKSVNLSETIQELEDLEHYLTFLKGTEHFYKGKKFINRFSSCEIPRENSSESLILLQRSREELRVKEAYLANLKSRAKNHHPIHHSSYSLPTENDLERKLEILKAEETRQRAKINFYNNRKHGSSLSTNDSAKDWLQSSEKLKSFDLFLTDIKSKHYHLSEIPIEFS